MGAKRYSLGVLLVTLSALVVAGPARAAMSADKLRTTLHQLWQNDRWGEVVLDGGRIRAIKVDSLGDDSVAVREVIGAFQERAAVYALVEMRSVRELGEYRIPLRRAPYRTRKSLFTALALETLPAAGGRGYFYLDGPNRDLVLLGSLMAPTGLGFFYVGEPRQALALIGFSAVAVGTGLLTKEEAVAGWMPISAWIKVASLLHLGDEVRAMNAAHREAIEVTLGAGPESSLPAVLVRWSF